MCGFVNRPVCQSACKLAGNYWKAVSFSPWDEG